MIRENRCKTSLPLIASMFVCLVLGGLQMKSVAAEASKSYEPPINVITVLHIDPEPQNRGETEFKITREMYDKAKDNILFLMEQARKRGFKMDAMFNGYYMQSVIEYNDYDHIKQFLA